MSTDELIDLLKLAASLMEINDENAFKSNAYKNASFNLEKLNVDISLLTDDQVTKLEGVGKSIAQAIIQYKNTGTFEEYEKVALAVPEGVASMLTISGLGPKKIRTLWKELDITNKKDLLAACKNNTIANAKGFGFKTQKSIEDNLLFELSQQGKLRLDEALILSSQILSLLQSKFSKVVESGDVLRKDETIETLSFLVAKHQNQDFENVCNSILDLDHDFKKSSPFVWRGNWLATNTKVEIHSCELHEFVSQNYLLGASPSHLSEKVFENKTVMHVLKSNSFETEQQFFDKINLPFITPELREGLGEWQLAKENQLPQLITYNDLKGPLHNHSTWSDGKNTLSEIVDFCKLQGWQYLGISDHSQSATYANGLQPERVIAQIKEIDLINAQNSDFKIFKGIESDILGDGSLDYTNDILALFDYVVASVHSGLNMDEDKATDRLIKAIENPYTTILGHPTGRLLLRRKGYEINHKKIIDACAANKVAIEINANPWRLDMSWHYIKYATDKGVKIAICPDAHENNGFYDMHFGIWMGRKGMLTAENCINTFNVNELERYFELAKS